MQIEYCPLEWGIKVVQVRMQACRRREVELKIIIAKSSAKGMQSGEPHVPEFMVVFIAEVSAPQQTHERFRIPP